MENLDRVEADPLDLTARENLSWASVAALLGGGPNVGRSGNFVVHNLEHPLSGYTDVSHGHGLAALWPRYMRFIAAKREAKIARFGQACLDIPAGPSAAEKTLAGIEGWLRQHQLWFNLGQFGADADSIEKMASDAVRLYGGRRKLISGPVPLDQAKAAEIYRMAL
jgi:alcohol dehydrogenase YqhD (iron-dependent ADH family)